MLCHAIACKHHLELYNIQVVLLIFRDLTMCSLLDSTNVWRNLLLPSSILKTEAEDSCKTLINIHQTINGYTHLHLFQKGLTVHDTL